MAHDDRHGKPAGAAPAGGGYAEVERGEAYGLDFLFMVRPMLMMLSAITPSPTQRRMPMSPRYRQRLRPCRLLVTLMRPSHPVRHFWPLRNQRFFCSRLRSGLLVERLGMQTRLTPLAFAAASFLAEEKPASAATRCGVQPSVA